MPTEKRDPTEDRSLNPNYNTHPAMQVEQEMLLKISSSWSHSLITQKYRAQPCSPGLLPPPQQHLLSTSWAGDTQTALHPSLLSNAASVGREGMLLSKERKRQKKRNSSVFQKLWESEAPGFQSFWIFNYFWKTQLNSYERFMQILKNVFGYLNSIKC